MRDTESTAEWISGTKNTINFLLATKITYNNQNTECTFNVSGQKMNVKMAGVPAK